jgi:hypothetical protein
VSNEKPSRSNARGSALWPSLRAGVLFVAILVLAVFGGGLGLGRARIVERLAEVPRPREMPVTYASPLAGESGGTRSLNAARRLAGSGDSAGALRLLGTIPREDPAFPAAERLRSEMKGAPGGRR